MKTHLLTLFFASFVIFGLFAFSGVHNCAHAKTYGPTAACPADPTKTVGSFYPGQSISSSDIHIVILGQGVPAGIRFQASAAAPVCSAVQCLLRSDGKTTNPMTGDRIDVVIDTLGCGGAGSGCTDTALVTVDAYDTIVGFQCAWHVSPNGAPGSFSLGNTASVTLANGTPSSAYFMLICTPVASTLTPTKSPTPFLTPTKSPTPPSPTKSPTPSVTKPPIGAPSLTPTKSPTPPSPTKSLTPTIPASTLTPTITEAICPVPATPVVRVNCPLCTPAN